MKSLKDSNDRETRRAQDEAEEGKPAKRAWRRKESKDCRLSSYCELCNYKGKFLLPIFASSHGKCTLALQTGNYAIHSQNLEIIS